MEIKNPQISLEEIEIVSPVRAAEIQAILEHYDEWESTNLRELKNLRGHIRQFPINEQQPLLDRMQEIIHKQK